jgi:hypothetical protein
VIRDQGSGIRRSYRRLCRRGNVGAHNFTFSLGRARDDAVSVVAPNVGAHNFTFSLGLCALIAGCRGIIPLPGCLRGSAPQGFDFGFYAPARIQHGPRKITFPRIVAESPILAGAWGERGLAPYRRVNARSKRGGSRSRRQSRRFLQKISALGSIAVSVGFADANASFCALWESSSGNRGQPPFPPNAPARVFGLPTGCGRVTFCGLYCVLAGAFEKQNLEGRCPIGTNADIAS